MRRLSRLQLKQDGWRALRLAFLDDEALLACGWQPRDPLLRLWLVDSGLLRGGGAPLRRVIDTGGLRLGAVTLAANAELVACGYSLPNAEPDRPCCRVWTLPRGRLAAELISGAPLAALALAFVGADLLAIGHDDAVSLWSLASETQLVCWSGGFGGPVTALAAAGHLLAAAAETAVVYLWRLPDGIPLGQLSAGQGVRTLALSADGRLLACATGTPAEARRAYERGTAFAHQIEVWALDAEPRRLAALNVAAPACNLCFASSGVCLAAACGELLLWDIAAGAAVAQLAAGSGRGCAAVTFAPAGRRLAAGSTSGALDVWELD